MIEKMSAYGNHLLRILLCFLLLHLQLIDAVPLLVAADEQSVKAKLDQAEESYYNGNPQQSITLARQCLTDSLLSMDNRIRAHKILARSYLALEEFESAKETVLLLLELDSAYQPTLEQESPRFVALVEGARAEYAARSQAEQAVSRTGRKKWIWLGAGGAAVAAIIVIVASASGGADNSNTNQPLPAPPPLP